MTAVAYLPPHVEPVELSADIACMLSARLAVNITWRGADTVMLLVVRLTDCTTFTLLATTDWRGLMGQHAFVGLHTRRRRLKCCGIWFGYGAKKEYCLAQ